MDRAGDARLGSADPVEGRGAGFGLEYLFGVVEAPAGGADRCSAPFWAHDRAQEKQALVDFLDYVAERRAAHPDLHIYHYAPYERTALLRLAAGTTSARTTSTTCCADGVLVDLYAVVRGAVRVSQRSYSIKKLEPLYMGDRAPRRRGDDGGRLDRRVRTSTRGLRRGRRRAEATRAARRRSRDYNEYDCVSTLRLRDWLLEPAAERGVADRRPAATVARGAGGARRPSRPPSCAAGEGAERRPRRARPTSRPSRCWPPPSVPPAGAQAVLVGALRPAAATRSTSGSTHATSSWSSPHERCGRGPGRADQRSQRPARLAPGRAAWGPGSDRARRRPGRTRLRRPRPPASPTSARARCALGPATSTIVERGRGRRRRGRSSSSESLPRGVDAARPQLPSP